MTVEIPPAPNNPDLNAWREWLTHVISRYADAKQGHGPFAGMIAATELSRLEAEELRTMPIDKLRGIVQFAVIGGVSVGLEILSRSQAGQPLSDA